jgi:hypothetical protein
MRRATIWMIALLAAGCGPVDRSYYELSDGIEDLDTGPYPDIDLDPETVDFGTVHPDDEPRDHRVIVHNDGFRDLHISGIELTDPQVAVEIGAISSVLIRPLEEARFELTWTPDDREELDTWVDVESDDPHRPVVQVHLIGRSLAAGSTP